MEREEYTINIPCRNSFELLNDLQQPDADDHVPIVQQTISDRPVTELEPDLHQPDNDVPSLKQTISDRPGTEPEPVPVNDPVGGPSNPSMKYDLLPNGYLTSKTDSKYIFVLCAQRSWSLCKLHSETKPLAYFCEDPAVCNTECLKIHWHPRSASCKPTERAYRPNYYNEANEFNPADFSA